MHQMRRANHRTDMDWLTEIGRHPIVAVVWVEHNKERRPPVARTKSVGDGASDDFRFVLLPSWGW